MKKPTLFNITFFAVILLAVANIALLGFLLYRYRDLSKIVAPQAQPEAPKLEYSDKFIILLYHFLGDPTLKPDDPNAELTIRPEDFEKQMDYLKNNGYTTLTLDEVISYRDKGLKIPKKSVVVSFDDGHKSIYENAFPVIKKNNQKMHLFIVYSLINQSGFLSVSQLKTLKESGLVSFGSHSVKHKRLGQLSDDLARVEITESKTALEQRIGVQVKTFAYPYGNFTDTVMRYVENAGYTYAVTTEDGIARVQSDDPLLLPRIFIKRDTTLDDFKKILAPLDETN